MKTEMPKHPTSNAQRPTFKGESVDMQAVEISVFWYSIAVWNRFAQLSMAQRMEASQAASDIISCNERVALGDATAEIPHFGKCSGVKCIAIISVQIVTRAKTDHSDSPFLRAARSAMSAARFIDPLFEKATTPGTKHFEHGAAAPETADIVSRTGGGHAARRDDGEIPIPQDSRERTHRPMLSTENKSALSRDAATTKEPKCK